MFAGGFEAMVLHRECSVHVPILCPWKNDSVVSPRHWLFLRAWCTTEGFVDVVRSAWSSIASDLNMSTLLRKMKATRLALIDWNHNSFGNIFDRKAAIEDSIVSLEEALIGDWNFEDFTCSSDLKGDWRDICSQEETFWKQKSRLHWLHEGDSNTKFFHAMAKARSAMASVSTIVDDFGLEHIGVDATHSAAVSFFHCLLSSKAHSLDEVRINLISVGISAR